jgi:hypothetical protein
LTGWLSDIGATFKYSGKEMRPPPGGLTPRVAAVRDALAALTGQWYDSVLVNLYEDGKCGMKYHVDPLVSGFRACAGRWMGRRRCLHALAPDAAWGVAVDRSRPPPFCLSAHPPALGLPRAAMALPAGEASFPTGARTPLCPAPPPPFP